MLKQLIKTKVQELYPEAEFDVLIPPNPRLGDYSINIAFGQAKLRKKDPKSVASQLAEEIYNIPEIKQIVSQVKNEGAYINFYLSREFLQKKLKEISSDENYGESDEGERKKVIIEYSSPNIAKPMHIGHVRSTIIGDALANVYESLGYEVIRWNFIGDWGTQFGKLIAAFKIWNTLPSDTIEDLSKIYVKFHEAIKDNPELEKKGQEEFSKLEKGDEENKQTWERIRATSIKEFGNIYKQLNINQFDVIKGESDYEPKLKPLIEELKNKGLAKESEGALIIELDNLPPAMLEKSDGATLYITRDLASLQDRINNYQPLDRILYVVANQQALHFQQLESIATKSGLLDGNTMKHVKFGMVLGEDGKKLATREGKVVPLQEVIDKLNELSLNTVKEKNPDLGEEEAKIIAKAVSIGALKYNDLKQHPYSDITFNWKAMLDLSGDSGPYVQYTYARLKNISKKIGNHEGGDISLLIDERELKMIKKILDFPDAIIQCTKNYTLNSLALYLYELAGLANNFYEQIRIIEDDIIERRNARLTLIETTASILKKGLSLLGIETLEKI